MRFSIKKINELCIRKTHEELNLYEDYILVLSPFQEYPVFLKLSVFRSQVKSAYFAEFYF